VLSYDCWVQGYEGVVVKSLVLNPKASTFVPIEYTWEGSITVARTVSQGNNPKSSRKSH